MDQEQVMQIARDLAGFSMGEADILRKAVGKKIIKLLKEQKEKFIDGCVKNGIFKDLAEKIFSFIEPFAGYGFNRSHAACYALIGYQTAYLKAHWPAEFMAALLTADQHDSDRIAIEIEECRKMGFEIMPPDINESFDSFTVVTEGTKENRVVGQEAKINTIRFGLKAIKNVGEHIVDEIIKNRKEKGAFIDIFDLLTRITDKDLNKKSLESLIKCGALDSLGDRSLFLNNLEKLLQFNKEVSKKLSSKQTSLFSNLPTLDSFTKPELIAGLEIKEIDKINWEKELLGLFISKHPLSMLEDKLNGLNKKINSLSVNDKSSIIIAGVITSIKKIVTRSGESMIFAKLEDPSASLEVLVFPKLLKENPDIWLEGNLVLVEGQLSEKDSDLKLLLNQAYLIDQENPELSINNFKKKLLTWRQNNPNFNKRRKYLNNNSNKEKNMEKKKNETKEINPLKLIFKKEAKPEELINLKNFLAKYPGNNSVYFKVIISDKAKVLKSDIKVVNSSQLHTALNDNFSDLLIIVADQ